MGYNGNNRRFRSDMFSKRDSKRMGNLVSGILAGLICAPFAIIDSLPNSVDVEDVKPVSKTTAVILIIVGVALAPLFIPLILFALEWFDFPFVGIFVFFALVFIPFIVWGSIIYLVIEAFTYVEIQNEVKPQEISKYDKLLNTIYSENLDNKYSEIRTKYYNTIDFNAEIDKRITDLKKEILKYQKKARFWSIFPPLKKKNKRIIASKSDRITQLETSYKEQIIDLEEHIGNEIVDNKINAGVYLLVDEEIKQKQTLDFDTLSPLTKGDGYFFKVNKEPIEALKFKGLEICFYSDVVLFMTKSNFIIVDKECLVNTFQTILIHPRSQKFALKTKVIGLIFYAEVYLLNIELFSQKIGLLFTNNEDLKLIYDLAIKNS